MRGLKPNVRNKIFNCILVASFTDAWIETPTIPPKEDISPVASFTDAWIETKIRKKLTRQQGSHLLQMRGLKHMKFGLRIANVMSHLLQMRGLKPSDLINEFICTSRIFYRCVD